MTIKRWALLWLPFLLALACNATGGGENNTIITPPTLAATVTTATEPTTAVNPNTPAPTITTIAATPSLERIRFESGGIAATVQGTAAAGVWRRYVFGALGGQNARLRISSTGDSVNFGLIDPAGQPLKRIENEDRQIELVLPTTGDYTIRIGSANDSVAYTLTLEIDPLDSGE